MTERLAKGDGETWEDYAHRLEARLIHQSEFGHDKDDALPVCRSCDRAQFMVSEDGLCVKCDMQARTAA